MENPILFQCLLYLTPAQEQEMEKQKLLFHQARLANRGVAEMVLLQMSACKGLPSDMVMKTLELGISILRGGNIDIQMVSARVDPGSHLEGRSSVRTSLVGGMWGLTSLRRREVQSPPKEKCEI